MDWFSSLKVWSKQSKITYYLLFSQTHWHLTKSNIFNDLSVQDQPMKLFVFMLECVKQDISRKNWFFGNFNLFKFLPRFKIGYTGKWSFKIGYPARIKARVCVCVSVSVSVSVNVNVSISVSVSVYVCFMWLYVVCASYWLKLISFNFILLILNKYIGVRHNSSSYTNKIWMWTVESPNFLASSITQSICT